MDLPCFLAVNPLSLSLNEWKIIIKPISTSCGQRLSINCEDLYASQSLKRILFRISKIVIEDLTRRSHEDDR